MQSTGRRLAAYEIGYGGGGAQSDGLDGGSRARGLVEIVGYQVVEAFVVAFRFAGEGAGGRFGGRAFVGCASLTEPGRDQDEKDRSGRRHP